MAEIEALFPAHPAKRPKVTSFLPLDVHCIPHSPLSRSMASAMHQSSELSGPAAVKDGLGLLSEDIGRSDLSNAERERILGQLKALGRDVNNVKTAYDASAVKTLGHYAFGEYPRQVAREALRCIANALILVPATQDAFANSGYVPKAAESMSLLDDDDEFLASRILFLMTYNKSTNVPKLVTDHDLPSKILVHIDRHLKDGEPLVGAGITSMALAETLKLIFNLINFAPQHLDAFLPALRPLFTILGRARVPSPALQPPMNYLLNALATLDTEQGGASIKQEFVPDDATLKMSIGKLVEVLQGSLTAYTQVQLDTQLISVVTILRRVNSFASNEIRDQIKRELLPKDSERDLPLGQSATLASRLLKLTTAPGLVHLPEAVSSLLFELSDKDAHTFVKNVGYGYAAGYLMTHKIPIPENAKQTSAAEGEIPINPITGQRLDKEPDVPVPNMSQEEKEREAERLFVLFERLKATGVVDVKNPVEQAKEEGRFHELPDSDGD